MVSPTTFTAPSSSLLLPSAPNEKSYKVAIRANDLFERGQYNEAIIDYTKVLQLSKDCSKGDQAFVALIHSNRSACYIKTKEYEKARRDAVQTIDLASTWSKVCM